MKPNNWSGLIALLIMLFGGISPAAAADPSEKPAVQIPVAPSNESANQGTRLQNYSLQEGANIKIPAAEPVRYVVINPRIAEVTGKETDGLQVKGLSVGDTLVLVWDREGLRTFKVTVAIPKEILMAQQKMAERSTALYQSRKKRMFRFFYEPGYTLLEQAPTLNKLVETRKTFQQHIAFQGGTPFGELHGQTFYEYRKEASMGKSVAIPRDFAMGLWNSQIWKLKGYDLLGGENFMQVNQFGFPGVRYNGFMLQPSRRRIAHPEAGQIDATFMIGKERDGSIIDNPPGIQNRKMKDEMSVQKINYYLWPAGVLSAGAFERWSGPGNGQSSKNYTGEYDMSFFRFFRTWGEFGLDDLRQTALDLKAGIRSRWFELVNRMTNINKHYRTVTGQSSGRGNLGYQGNLRVRPLLPLFNYDSLGLDFETWIYRDRLSVNPDHPTDYIKNYRAGLTWNLPTGMYFIAGYLDENLQATSFPYTHHLLDGRLGKDFWLDSPWVRNIGLFTRAAYDRYRKAPDSPGFNSDRTDWGAGVSLGVWGGFSFSSEFRLDRLYEKTPEPPRKTTYPREWIIEGNWSHGIWKLPLMVHFGIRYTKEFETYGKVHQPFMNEDRIEMRQGVNWRVPRLGDVFLESRVSNTKSIINAPRTAEFSLDTGIRAVWDSPIYIPGRGSIEGFVFRDFNGNGIKDLNEPGIEGYKVSIRNGKTVETDKSGYYRLKVKESQVVVAAQSELPEGFFYSTASEQAIEMLPDKDVKVDFGITTQVMIKGRTFLDLNENSEFDPEDIPLTGIRVRVDTGQFGTTAGDGWYSLLRVPPGKNRIVLDLISVPMGYRALKKFQLPIEATAGESITCDFPFAAERVISGHVFDDLNGDGSQGKDEPGIAGVTVLMGTERAVTNSSGEYIFRSLRPGKSIFEIDSMTLPKDYRTETDKQAVDIPPTPMVRMDIHFALQKISDQKNLRK
jgi:hypothetical protein